MAKKNQTTRLTSQHKASHGVVGIFGEEAKEHDCAVGDISGVALDCLKKKFPKLSFRHRRSVSKKEINDSLKKIGSSDIWRDVYLTCGPRRPQRTQWAAEPWDGAVRPCG